MAWLVNDTETSYEIIFVIIQKLKNVWIGQIKKHVHFVIHVRRSWRTKKKKISNR